MKPKDLKYICAVDSVYSLFLYLLINKNIDNTIFLFGHNINKTIRSKFNHYLFAPIGVRYNRFNRLILYFYVFFFVKRKRIERLSFFGQDHIFLADYFKANYSNLAIIEDGEGNYGWPNLILEKCKNNRMFNLYNKYIYRLPYGLSNSVSTIYLTGIKPIPEVIAHKVKNIDIYALWDNLELGLKNVIKNIFIEDDYINNLPLNRDVILVTQPLDFDGYMTETEKIDMYKTELSKISENRLIIKTHPRETTQYSRYFPNAVIIDKPIPIELLFMLLKGEFSANIELYSHSSTGLYNVPPNFKTHMFGDLYPFNN